MSVRTLTKSQLRRVAAQGGLDSPRYKITCRQRADATNTYELIDMRTGVVKMRSRNFAKLWARYRSVK